MMKNNRKEIKAMNKFEAPEIEILLFNISDVILTESGDIETDFGGVDSGSDNIQQ